MMVVPKIFRQPSGFILDQIGGFASLNPPYSTDFSTT